MVEKTECGVRSAECGVRSAKFGVRSLSQLKCFFRFGGDFCRRLLLDSVFSTLWGHKVEKTESSNNRAQIVYNQIHQCLTEKGMNY